MNKITGCVDFFSLRKKKIIDTNYFQVRSNKRKVNYCLLMLYSKWNLEKQEKKITIIKITHRQTDRQNIKRVYSGALMNAGKATMGIKQSIDFFSLSDRKKEKTRLFLSLVFSFCFSSKIDQNYVNNFSRLLEKKKFVLSYNNNLLQLLNFFFFNQFFFFLQYFRTYRMIMTS